MKKTFARLFLIVVAGMCLLAIASFGYYNIYLYRIVGQASYQGTSAAYGDKEYPQTKEYAEYRQEVLDHLLDFEAVYGLNPKDAGLSGQTEYVDSQAVASKGIVGKISDMIHTIEGKIEQFTNSEHILGKQSFVAAKRKVDHVVGLDMTNSLAGGQNDTRDVRDLVGKTEEGQLGWIQDDMDLTERIENMVDFGLRMKEADRDFVILENPNKYASIDGIRDYSEEKYKQLHQAYDCYELDWIDAGEEMHKLGMTDQEIFFDTDFHWRPTTGLVADQILSEYLNKKCGYQIDTSLFDTENYHTEIQVDGFLGFLGKKVTLEYTEPDDFPIIRPDFETKLTVFNSYDLSEKTGTVEETLFWKELLDVGSLYEGNKYEMYGLTDQGLITVRNHLVKDGKKILMIKESYANCMTPFLAPAVEQLDIIDLRAFTGSLQAYIEETNPDTIVMVYGLSCFEDDALVDHLFDFR